MSDVEETASVPVATVVTPQAKVPIASLLIAIVLSVVLATAAVGGAVAWAVRTNRLPLAGVTKVEVAAPAPEIPTKLVPLDPLLVNLADADGHGYLRVALTLKVEDTPPAKGSKPKEEKDAKSAAKNEHDAEERDAVLAVLGRENGEQLLAPDGKERLKKDLEAALKERVPEVKVVDVLITEFLVQR